MTKAPCYKCSRHEFGCKKNCNEWIEWQVIHANEKAAADEEKRKEYEANVRMIDKNIKLQRRKRKK